MQARDTDTISPANEHVLGTIVGLYYSLALAALYFGFGLLAPPGWTSYASRGEVLLLGLKQAGGLLFLGIFAGFCGLAQVQFPAWLKRRNSRSLTHLYFWTSLLASVGMFVMVMAKECCANGTALVGALVWAFFYTVSMLIATVNTGVAFLLRTKA